MTVTTRDFGTIELEESEVLQFEQPVYGFEAYRRYVLLQDEEIGPHFAWLQSVEDAETCFIMIDPDALKVEYRPTIPESAAGLLGMGDYLCWCIVTVAERFEDSTANLKSPILLNPVRHLGAQVILEDRYPIRQPLLDDKEANESC